jgi:hypothetical protein
MISGCSRLPNGNTLITEGATGRLFEVTTKHEVAWEYISPWSLVSKFGPTPAVFRSYRIGLDDARLDNFDLSSDKYSELNASIANGQIQTEPDYEDRTERNEKEEAR